MGFKRSQLGSSSYLSSTSSSNAGGNYDVFMSFRGADIRKSFTDHLQFALDQRGFDVFKDDEDLLRGQAIKFELMKAIEESRLFVVIFSENYASSTWCLDEVVEIVRCMKSTGRTVLPIFYHVDPSEVRKQTGKYQQAFSEYEETLKSNKERVDNWRSALVEVANLAGWELKDQHESRFIQDIVRFVWKTLNPVQSPDFEDLVGMDSRLMELNLEVCIGLDDVRFTGICGMGGIGKTTLAIAYYNWMCHQFGCSAFLENVREECSSPSGLLRLQEQLLCKTLKAETVKIWNKSEGIKMTKTRLCSKRVLIVIDDVDKMTQLKELAGSPDWFGSGSRIIITMRDCWFL